jgi:2-(1,2-epoxy-1,2-dihydrophenyl)acetyl-CoA isomerase
VRDHYNPITLSLATMPKPVVAAVNGIAAGAGASFALACDFRVVAETAGFNLAFSAIGLTADSGLSWTLPRLIGGARAIDLLMRPRTIHAVEAQTMGLVTELTNESHNLDAAQNLAAELAAGPTVAYGAIRRSLAFSAGHGLAESLAFEDEMQTAAGTSADHRDAVDAFLAKQKPTFKGL